MIERRLSDPYSLGNFELLVLEPNGSSGQQLRHVWRDNSTDSQPWNLDGIVSSSVSELGCIIESSYGPGNLEVLVREGKL
jgi:hypothetical protein